MLGMHPATTTPSPPDILGRTVQWIEAQLDRSLTLEQIAQQAGLSPYHFSRLFTARMGRSVMSHVRGRRLLRAARHLTEHPGLALVELAFDAGFESQEAFTRAFKRVFGIPPGRFRQGFAGFSTTPIEGQFPMTAPSHDATTTTSSAVVQLPDFVTLAAFTVAGLSRRFEPATKSEIPQLWSALTGALPFKGQDPSWTTYGVIWSVDKEEGSFQYMAGVGVQPEAQLPPRFEEKRIPAATYAVFRITLNGEAVHPQMKSAMATIWGELVPAAGFQVADGPDFERYDGHFAPDRAGAVVDFYLPVKV
jgi:AraC family transcriptional regulator